MSFSQSPASVIYSLTPINKTLVISISLPFSQRNLTQLPFYNKNKYMYRPYKNDVTRRTPAVSCSEPFLPWPCRFFAECFWDLEFRKESLPSSSFFISPAFRYFPSSALIKTGSKQRSSGSFLIISFNWSNPLPFLVNLEG